MYQQASIDLSQKPTLKRLKEQVPEATDKTHLKDTVLLQITDLAARILVTSTFALAWRERRMYPEIPQALGDVLQYDVRNGRLIFWESQPGQSFQEQARSSSLSQAWSHVIQRTSIHLPDSGCPVTKCPLSQASGLLESDAVNQPFCLVKGPSLILF
jgi:hypothetical protein